MVFYYNLSATVGDICITITFMFISFMMIITSGFPEEAVRRLAQHRQPRREAQVAPGGLDAMYVSIYVSICLSVCLSIYLSI